MSYRETSDDPRPKKRARIEEPTRPPSPAPSPAMFHFGIRPAISAIGSYCKSHTPFTFRRSGSTRTNHEQHRASRGRHRHSSHQDWLTKGLERIQQYSDRVEARCNDMVSNGLPHLYDACSQLLADMDAAANFAVRGDGDTDIQTPPMSSEEQDCTLPPPSTVDGHGTTQAPLAYASSLVNTGQSYINPGASLNPWSCERKGPPLPNPAPAPLDLPGGLNITAQDRTRGEGGAGMPPVSERPDFRVPLAGSLEDVLPFSATISSGTCDGYDYNYSYIFDPNQQQQQHQRHQQHQFNDVHWNHLNRFDDEPAAQHHPILPVDSPPTCNQDKLAARVYKWEQDLQTIAFKLIDICSSLEYAIQWNGYDDWGHWGDREHSNQHPDEGTRDKSRIPSPPTNLLDLRAMERSGFLDELQGLSRGANKILDMMEQYHRSGPPTRTAAVDHGPILSTLTAESRERPSCHEQEGSDALGRLVVTRHEHRLKMWATDLRASAIGLCKVLTRHFVAKA